MMDIPENFPEIFQRGEKHEIEAEVIIVDGPFKYQCSAEYLSEIKSAKNEIQKGLAEQKTKAYNAHKDICKAENKYLGPLDHAESLIKEKMSAWYDKQAEIEEKIRVNGGDVKSIIPKLDNIETREQWGFEITDKDSIPDEYFVLDTKKLRDFAKQTKGLVPLAGVEIKKRTLIASL